jgi:hypothetical protein
MQKVQGIGVFLWSGDFGVLRKSNVASRGGPAMLRKGGGC